MSHLRPGIVDFARSTRLDPESLSQFDTKLIGTLYAKGSGEEEAVELFEGDGHGGTHKELPHQTACIKEATVMSGL